MRVFLLLLGIVISFQAIGKNGSAELEINSTMDKLNLTAYIQVLEDKEHAYSIEDILSNENLPFKSLTETGNSFGFSKSVYWIKFSINVLDPVKDSLLLEFEYPLLDKLTLYTKDERGELHRSISGDSLPFFARELDYRNYLFQITPLAGQPQTYIMRLQTEGSMQIPISLWVTSEFVKHVNSMNLVLGIYYGVMLILMLVAFVAFLYLHNFLFLYYSIYLFSFIMFQLSVSGLSFQYLWPEYPYWTSRATGFFIGLGVFFALLFSGSFLRVWQYHKRIRWLFFLLMCQGLLGILLSLFGDYSLAILIASFAGISITPVIILATIFSIKTGYRPAKIFLFAWGIYLLGVLISALVYFGQIESSFYTLYSMQMASIMEVMLLGYALIEQVRGLNKEKELATVSANRYLQQLNEGLESQVAERTLELQEKNVLLSDLALRDSMTGLLNHNTLIERLKNMTSTAQRYGHSLSIVMLDIDHFKKINDTYGHPAGDKVILAFAEVLISSIRESDSCGRYGGEEFLLLLPETGGDQARELANNIRLKIMKLQIDEIQLSPVSASFGISVFDGSNPKIDLIGEADKAMYKAKESGRNKVVLGA